MIHLIQNIISKTTPQRWIVSLAFSLPLSPSLSFRIYSLCTTHTHKYCTICTIYFVCIYSTYIVHIIISYHNDPCLLSCKYCKLWANKTPDKQLWTIFEVTKLTQESKELRQSFWRWEQQQVAHRSNVFSVICLGSEYPECTGENFSNVMWDGHPTFNRNPYNGYINPYYWVDEFIPYCMEILGVDRPWHICCFTIYSRFAIRHATLPWSRWISSLYTRLR